MTISKEAVTVTGANGFIGSWLVRTLLDSGYTTIHASIFPGSDASHLFSLPGAKNPGVRLELYEADVMDFFALRRAVEGTSGVFHVASPCTLEDSQDPTKELVEPAVMGTLNMLEAARQANVRRVVLTSSMSAMVPNPGWPQNTVIDESSWTDLDYCKSRQKWYPVSKTLAEQEASKFAKAYGMDVVAIHPATCLGKLLQPDLNASCAVLQQLLQGSKDTQEYHWLGAVHVKDVAKAHVLIFETPSASGRYLCTNGIYQFTDFASKVSELFPEFPVHRKFGVSGRKGDPTLIIIAGTAARPKEILHPFPPFIFDVLFTRFIGETQPGLISCKDAAKRLINLGLLFTSVEDAVRETVESLKAKGFLKQEMPQ